jgi:hypothetical protein
MRREKVHKILNTGCSTEREPMTLSGMTAFNSTSFNSKTEATKSKLLIPHSLTTNTGTLDILQRQQIELQSVPLWRLLGFYRLQMVEVVEELEASHSRASRIQDSIFSLKEETTISEKTRGLTLLKL